MAASSDISIQFYASTCIMYIVRNLPIEIMKNTRKILEW